MLPVEPESRRNGSNGYHFPSLPILAAEETRRSDRERYGGLFYLGAAGLVVVLGLVTWFAVGVWSMSDVWSNVYALHDPARPEPARVAAAFALAGDPRVNQRQRWDMALRTELPDLARYLLARSLTAEAIAADPAGYARSVAESEGPGWPDWFRLALLRPMALGAGEVRDFPASAIQALRDRDDPAIRLWTDFAAAATREGDRDARTRLREAAGPDGPDRELADRLLLALEAEGETRKGLIEQAADLTRDHHPATRAIWRGWSTGDAGPVPAR